MDCKHIWEQLVVLRDLTRRTGMLHEAQVIHLELWAKIAIPHSEDVKVLADVDRKRIVVKACVPRGTPDPDDFSYRLITLDRSVKDLLGEEWSVSVTKNKKVILGNNGKRNSRKRTNG